MPPKTTTIGHLLINDVLPKELHITGPITNKGLHDHVVDLAKKDPIKYVQTITALKRRGDEIATLEGVSVGLDDIQPDYIARDKILNPVIDKLNKTTNKKEREKIVIDAQNDLIEHTKTHSGSMTHMALSGARGNIGQLMKIVSTPLATVNPKKGIDPVLLKHSYSEGLRPSEYWVTVPEVRHNEVQARISVSDPGEVAKVLVNNMASTVVTIPDCNTDNGVHFSVSDGHILDRFSQNSHGIPKNTLITSQLIQELKHKNINELLVRSPMTCAATHGVCQMCQGHNEKGQIHRIGSTIGVRAAQAMAEPLTQMALSARHGTLTIKETKLDPVGLKGVRQFLEIPKSFNHEAVLATKHGVIKDIEKAPQGGHYIYLDQEKLYAAPELTITKQKGDKVEQGDALTNGVPHPVKVIKYKGIGAGRKYYVDAMHTIYKNEGVNLDKRHLELLAKSEMNHLRLLDADDDHPEFLKGDIINYNQFKDAYQKDATPIPIDQAIGQRLGKEILHHTIGTNLTPNVVKELKEKGISNVFINKKLPQTEFVMKPFTMNPLLETDWMGRLQHRYLKGSIQQAAQFGEESDIHGTHPVPAYAYGAELRHGPEGKF